MYDTSLRYDRPVTDTSRATAFFNGSGVFPAGRVEASQAYTDWMSSTLQNAKRSHTASDEEQATLTEMLSIVLIEAQRIRGDNTSIGAISFPTHFNDVQFETVIYAAHKLDAQFWHPVRVRRSITSAGVTFPKDYCLKTLFKDTSNIEDDDPLVLIFEFRFGKLRIVIGRVGVPGVYREATESIGLPFSANDVHHALQRISLESMLHEVVSVIFSSDDAMADFSQVRLALGREPWSLLDQIQVPAIGPEYVGAVGAACHARQIAIFPWAVQDEDTGSFPIHEEL